VVAGKLLLGAALAAMVPVVADAQAPAPPAARAALPDPAKVVGEIQALIAREYVLPEMRKPLEAALAKGLASGRYAHVDPAELSNRLTADMAAVAHDKHLNIHFAPDEAQSLAAAPDAGDDDFFGRDGFWAKIANDNNQGVVKLEVLDGNVRYMNYRGFFWAGDKTAAAIDQAMAFLRGGDAIVIDLRDNGGGSPLAVRYLASYFIPADTKLVTGAARGSMPGRNLDNDIWAADVHMTPNGKFMYASERTSSSIGAFAVDASTGKLTYLSSTPTEKQPRGFAIDPTGKFLVATGEKSENVSVYAIDGATGTLKPVAKAPVGKGANWVEIVRFD